MHILLIAYEFPPIESAQGLRWGYLARELAWRGHTVQVIGADLGLPDNSRFSAPSLSVRRVFPGPFVGFSGRLARLRSGSVLVNEHATSGVHHFSLTERTYRFLRGGLNQLLIPDVRSEWLPWGWRAAVRAIQQQRPNLLIISHEPGVDLAIGRRLKHRFGLPLLADIGDPLLSCYSPRWRRSLDARFERNWLYAADALTVTTEGTRTLLQQRHHFPDGHITVIPQGFDTRREIEPVSIEFDSERLELLYTGTLYGAFRNPQPLFDALHEVPQARLTMVGYLDGIDIRNLAAHPQLRHLGRLPHSAVRALQCRADLLVNIGNCDDIQLPGKLFEYFGASRPILHLSQTTTDTATRILAQCQRGCSVEHQTDAIVSVLRKLCDAKLQNRLDADFNLDDANVAEWSWSTLGARLEALCSMLGGKEVQTRISLK